MAKHRKTRQEKMVADHRHVVYHLETSPAKQPSPSVKKTSSPVLDLDISVIKAQTASYSYVKSDLRKTVLITSAIVFAQIFLFIIIGRI